jgi:hypothetical protein
MFVGSWSNGAVSFPEVSTDLTAPVGAHATVDVSSISILQVIGGHSASTTCVPSGPTPVRLASIESVKDLSN